MSWQQIAISIESSFIFKDTIHSMIVVGCPPYDTMQALDFGGGRRESASDRSRDA